MPIPADKEWSWKLCKLVDRDTDGDGVPDKDDCAPLDATKWKDCEPSSCEALYNDQKLQEKGFTLAQVADKMSEILPASPDAIRIPTILSNFAGDGSLAAQLAIEVYSGAWQALGLAAFITFWKLLPGKST